MTVGIVRRVSDPGSTAEVAAVAAAHAVESERQRALPDKVVRTVVKAGFVRHFVPRRYGGHAGTFAELTTAVAELGQSCPSTAWCASVVAHVGRMAGFLPAAAAQDIWGDGPDSLIVGSLSLGGRAERVPGGWALTGRWPYISAIAHADWTLLCASSADTQDPVVRMFAVRRSECTVVETWNDVGMRATGSHTVVVDRVRVPEHRVADRVDLFTGRRTGAETNCYSVPLRAVNALSFAAPALGAARGLLGVWSDRVSVKRTGPPTVRTLPSAAFARSSGEIDVAQLLLDRAAALADRGGVHSVREESRNLRDCALAVDFLVVAADRLFRAAGTGAHSADEPLQRFWRDIYSMSSHVVLQFDAAAEFYTQERLSPSRG